MGEEREDGEEGGDKYGVGGNGRGRRVKERGGKVGGEK